MRPRGGTHSRRADVTRFSPRIRTSMKILLLNQCFYPDVVSTAQHMSDLAATLTARGLDVTVIAASRGYDDPGRRFSKRERWNGIDIFRVPTLPTGKGSRLKRALNILSFFFSSTLRLLLMPRFDVVIALTSPPLISALAALLVRLRGGRFVFWIMDLNPDEAIAAGWLKEGSRTSQVLESVLRFSAYSADRVIVLDRFMRDRIISKGVSPGRVALLPPWSHDREVGFDAAGREAFRARHGLTGKYVVMYSGNHSPCHPLDTILEAALQLAGWQDIAFCFIGGGSEYGKVRAFAERHGIGSIVCLPYQPLSGLGASLSAADLHVVVMGDALVGTVHPCKIYDVMAVGIPVLYIGPEPSHVADIAAANPRVPITVVAHGDVHGAAQRIVSGSRGELRESGWSHEGMREAARAYSSDRLLPLCADVIEFAAESRPALKPTGYPGRILVRKLKTLRSLPAADLCLAGVCGILLVTMKVALWTVPFHRVKRHVERPRGSGWLRGKFTAQQVGMAVRLAAQYVPGATCLTSALTAQILLNRAGIDNRIHVGVALDAGFEAHAWVESGGRILVGGAEDSSRFSTILTLEGPSA